MVSVFQENQQILLRTLQKLLYFDMAKDQYHQHVVDALEKGGWEITDDPYLLASGKIRYQVDIGAEKLISAKKGVRKILVEVKSFVGPSDINEFHRVVGQCVDYLVVLNEVDPDRMLFLAVPDFAWEGFFTEPAIQKSLGFISAKILVYDPLSKTITEWRS